MKRDLKKAVRTKALGPLGVFQERKSSFKSALRMRLHCAWARYLQIPTFALERAHNSSIKSGISRKPCGVHTRGPHYSALGITRGEKNRKNCNSCTSLSYWSEHFSLFLDRNSTGTGSQPPCTMAVRFQGYPPKEPLGTEPPTVSSVSALCGPQPAGGPAAISPLGGSFVEGGRSECGLGQSATRSQRSDPPTDGSNRWPRRIRLPNVSGRPIALRAFRRKRHLDTWGTRFYVSSASIFGQISPKKLRFRDYSQLPRTEENPGRSDPEALAIAHASSPRIAAGPKKKEIAQGDTKKDYIRRPTMDSFIAVMFVLINSTMARILTVLERTSSSTTGDRYPDAFLRYSTAE
ncbi:unnamed protein product [Nesidiocoris tenuis]|uniref:Uncharacterized protein n=1 Tax=Nesidiocoris tenuis TaxID=355587 RepID=A0A6H5GVW6_9HEMI|nr:unnamed protein product [Nesidiocoris tenuis]